MALSVQNVYGLLLRSRLLPLEQAKALYDQWAREAGDAAASVGHFGRWLVAQNALTEYQVSLLTRGHADGFFLNQYKVLDRVGKGRMAGVYRAVHELGQVVAVKVLPPSRARDPAHLGRFQREARLALLLDHPNIVRAYHVGRADDLHYIVMEYLEGETVEELLQRRGRLATAEAGRVVHQALLGLQHIHEKGLVHRDLKPANLMLVPAPGPAGAERHLVKVLDIGLGRALFEDRGPDQGDDGQLTGAGVLLGTPDYMAPEQARDPRTADIRSDVYSLGCVLYHLLAGQPVFPDTNVINQMIRHATEAPRPLKELNAAVPDALQHVVGCMLAKEPSQRYPTPGRAAQALHDFLAGGADAVAAPEASPQMHSYLTWVEAEGRNNGEPPAAPEIEMIDPGPAARPPGAAPGSAAGRPPPARDPLVTAARQKARKAAGVKRRAKRQRTKIASPAPPPAAPAPRGDAAKGYDVELVPAPADEAGARPSVWRLTCRDFLVFTLGVGGTLGAIGLAKWLAGRYAGGE